MIPTRRQEPSAPIKLHCPKCRRQNLFVTNTFTDTKAYEVNEGRITSAYVTGEMPDYIGSHAKCQDCGHKWRPRGEHWSDPA